MGWGARLRWGAIAVPNAYVHHTYSMVLEYYVGLLELIDNYRLFSSFIIFSPLFLFPREVLRKV